MTRHDYGVDMEAEWAQAQVERTRRENTRPVRREPDPIHDQLMARLDDWVENALDPQAAAAGLRAALTVCLTWERSSLRWEDQLPVPTWVGEIRRQVAEALGVEALGVEPNRVVARREVAKSVAECGEVAAPASPVSPAPDTEEGAR